MAELGMDAQFDRFQKLLIGDKLDIVRPPDPDGFSNDVAREAL